jgi:STE24 endopeptidase
MHLHVIICFALVIWFPHERPFEPVIGSPLWTWVLTWVQVPVLFFAAIAASAAALRRLDASTDGPQRAQHFYHRAIIFLRLTTVAGFGAALLATDWVSAVHAIPRVPSIPGLADLLVLAPFFAASVFVFVGTYRIDRALQEVVLKHRDWDRPGPATVWSFGQYLDFNLRHHLLVVTVPMILILIAFDLSGAHAEWLNDACRVAWAAEVAPGFAAAGVFVVAPLMLRYIWPTRPLPDGPLRRGLEETCRRIKLSYRGILIWQSGGMMVNAAVMGLFGPVRYVMLSDGLLQSMSREQIEAVFGHEAGHVRHRHMQFFLLFAVCSMLFLSAVVEALRLGVERGLLQIDLLTVQAVGGICVVAFWALGFGWISRRFERQADLFGARCVTPADPEQCRLPCSVHDDHAGERPASSLCSTGAALFTSALDRVAVLNGIPHEERSWRHSSISSRMRFLISQSGDPGRVRRFERLVRRTKAALLILTITGSIVAGIYVWDHPIYGIGRASEPPTPVRADSRPRLVPR